MPAAATHIVDENVGVITFNGNNGLMEFSFPIINSLYSQSFKFGIFEHYMYMYKGTPTNHCSDFYRPAISLSEDGNMLVLNINSSSANVHIKIDYDNNIRHFLYKCAKIYINYHLKLSAHTIPKIYIDTLEADASMFKETTQQ